MTPACSLHSRTDELSLPYTRCGTVQVIAVRDQQVQRVQSIKDGLNFNPFGPALGHTMQVQSYTLLASLMSMRTQT